MAREKKLVHKVQMTDRNTTSFSNLQEYGIQSTEEIQDALKNLLGITIKEMIETELDMHWAMKNHNALTAINGAIYQSAITAMTA